jgi:MutS domain I
MSVAELRATIDAAKAGRTDVIVLFDQGAFLNCFLDDAERLADAFGIVLGTIAKNTPEPIAVAGVPYLKPWHLDRLAGLGLTVEIVPPTAAQRSLMHDATPLRWHELSPAEQTHMRRQLEALAVNEGRARAIRMRLGEHLEPDQLDALLLPTGGNAGTRDQVAALAAFEALVTLIPPRVQH